LKIKCTFVYETTQYDTFADAKADHLSRKQIEDGFAKILEHDLNLFMDEKYDTISEVKAKII